jgi:CBS domain-containing protein
VGYGNLQGMLDGSLAGQALLLLLLGKFAAWSVALGSGTSGGTLAPLFTLGGALGALAGAAATALAPHAGIDPRLCALVGMAAIFAGAARTLLTAAVFAFEITQQPMGLLPLLGGCAAAYLVSALLLRHGIMTAKLARRGLRVPAEFPADHLDQERVGSFVTREVATLAGDATVASARQWLAQGGPGSAHPGFPVLDPRGRPLGILLARVLRDPELPGTATLASLFRHPAPVVHADHSLREAADHMVREGVGRLPVVDSEGRLIGILTRSDLLRAHGARLRADRPRRARLSLPGLAKPPTPPPPADGTGTRSWIR